jgi:3-deoxy-D-manno-octulosonate 8-phosphate phosphatase KdsC-like HAD superfamily phosphatase
MEVVEISDYKLSRNGGDACIRECYEKLFKPVLEARES